MNDDLAPVRKKKIGQRVHAHAGRPKTEIDLDLLAKLGESMLSIESIAIILDCSKATLYANKEYSDVLQKSKEGRKKSLLTAMWEKALIEKDTKMMIWLSKQHLGYRDVAPINATQINFNVYCKEVPKKQEELPLDETIEVSDGNTKS